MRIAFCTLPAAGHMNPMTALARRVQDRGHDVFFAGIPDCEPYACAAGMEFHPFGTQRFPPGSAQEILGRLSRLHGRAGLRYTIEQLLVMSEVTLAAAPEVLREQQAEALIWDEVGAPSALIAAQLRLPLIHIANALPIHRYDSVPPPFVGWRYLGGALGRLRNRFGYAAFSRVMHPIRTAFLDHARRMGLEFDTRDPNFPLSKLARISQMPAAFDFPIPELPPWFHYTGPFLDDSRPPVEFPWTRLTHDPLIYASMGTVQNGHEQVFRTIAAACAGLGCQLVLSIGEQLTAESVGPLPGDAIVVKQAPQLDLLGRAAICITHAGMNTTLESLAAGVPMVAIPITNDQPAIAARIAHHGAGVVVPYQRLTAGRLRRAVVEVQGKPAYRKNARRLQATIQAVNGLDRAVDIIERALLVRL